MTNNLFNLTSVRDNKPFEVYDYEHGCWMDGQLKQVLNSVINDAIKIVTVGFTNIHGKEVTFNLSEFSDYLRMK